MEQTTQQTIQKPPLPIKTKIAAWWMIVTGGIGVIVFIIYLMAYFGAVSKGEGLTAFVFLPFVAIPSFSLFIPGLLILLKKRGGWICSVIFLLLGVLLTILLYFGLPTDPASGIVIAIFFYSSIFLLIIFLPPFLLLFLDRKNFWKIAS